VEELDKVDRGMGIVVARHYFGINKLTFQLIKQIKIKSGEVLKQMLR
jgi:hypothetical protein